MKALPEEWRVHSHLGPEQRLRRLQRRFRAVSHRFDRAIKLRRSYRLAKRSGLAAIGVVVIFVAVLMLSPFPPIATLKHIAALPNCDAARAIGLAPAIRGAPGYWPSHDADEDGKACELWPRR